MKKPDWQIFEQECCDYLNSIYKDTSVKFYGEGGTNSNTSDITIIKNENNISSIEVKYSPSQSGQFVVKDQNDFYHLSNSSRFENTIYTQQIIDFLNKNKKLYTPKQQKSSEIEIEKEILIKWIQTHYKRKDSHFIITSTNLGSYKAIIPIDRIGEYFNVSAVIRRKRSGTRHISKQKIENCIEILKEHLISYNLTIVEVSDSLVILSDEDKLAREDRYFGENFFLSPNKNGQGYYMKERSSTNNLNVIFTLEYIGPKQNIGFEELDNFIKKF